MNSGLIQLHYVNKTFTVLAVSKFCNVDYCPTSTIWTDCNNVFPLLCKRFLFRFREFLLSPSNWSFTFFFLHDNGFGPFTRFCLCTNSARFPKVDSFKQFNVVCSCDAGSILAWRCSLAFSREDSDGASRLIALNAIYSNATPGSWRIRSVNFSSCHN